MMRTFLSVAPPVEVQREIQIVQRVLAKEVEAAGLRKNLLAWSPVEKMHLTLRFLGETDTDQCTEMASLLSKIAQHHEGLAVMLQGVGVFPNWRKPGVVWLGFGESPALLAMQLEVEAAAQRVGFAAEGRAYRPHLTLAYVHKHARAAEADQLGEVLRAAMAQEEIALWRETFPVHSIELMRSELLPGGARYSVLASEQLR